MVSERDLQLFTINGLRHRCAVESQRFFHHQPHEPAYCMELFRRAVVQRNELAWEGLYQQYLPLVEGWVRRHALFAVSQETAEYWVNRAFEKMWTAVSSEKFAHFADLAALLRYLQLCVHSVLVDEARRQEETLLLDDVPETAVSLTDNAVETTSVEANVFNRLSRHQFWHWIITRLHTTQEQELIYAYFVLALKPRDIVSQFPHAFPDIQEVYRLKENVLARLRRDTELHTWLKEF